MSPLLRHGWTFHGRPDGRVDLSTFIRRVVKSGDTGGFNGVSICSSTNIRTSLVHFSRSLHHLFGNPKVEHLVVDPQLLGSKKSPIFDDQPVDFKGIQQKLDSHPRHRSRFAGDFRSLQHFFLATSERSTSSKELSTVKYSSFCDLGKDFGSSYWNIVFLVHQVGWGEVQWFFSWYLWTWSEHPIVTRQTNIDVENQPFVDYFFWWNHGFSTSMLVYPGVNLSQSGAPCCFHREDRTVCSSPRRISAPGHVDFGRVLQ